MKLNTYDGKVKVKRRLVKRWCKEQGISLKYFLNSYTYDEADYLINK